MSRLSLYWISLLYQTDTGEIRKRRKKKITEINRGK